MTGYDLLTERSELHDMLCQPNNLQSEQAWFWERLVVVNKLIGRL